MRVAFYTATMGGAGHVARALTLRRGLLRQGFTGQWRGFGPPIPYASAQLDDYTVAEISRDERRSPQTARRSALALALQAYDPDLILVDMFWLPLLHILPTLRARAWLLLHSVPPMWLHGPPLARFDPRQYERVFAMEPLQFYQLPDTLEPFVICNPDECHPTWALKDFLGIPRDEHLTLIVQTGFTGEAEAIAREHAPGGGHIVTMSMHEGLKALFPIAPWLPGADRIIGGGGYHFFWETIWLGLQPRTLYHPFFRTIDHQHWRVQTLQHHPMRANGADTLGQLVQRG